MSIIGRMLRNTADHFGEEWIGKNESSLSCIESLVNQASPTLYMVTGELDPSLYERTSLPGQIESALQRGVKIKIVFHKNVGTVEQAKEAFKKTNPKMAELATRYSNKILFYWREKRPNGHYLVSDSDGIFLEEEHEAYGQRGAIAKSHTFNLGKKLYERFENFIKTSDCHQLSFA